MPPFVLIIIPIVLIVLIVIIIVSFIVIVIIITFIIVAIILVIIRVVLVIPIVAFVNVFLVVMVRVMTNGARTVTALVAPVVAVTVEPAVTVATLVIAMVSIPVMMGTMRPAVVFVTVVTVVASMGPVVWEVIVMIVDPAMRLLTIATPRCPAIIAWIPGATISGTTPPATGTYLRTGVVMTNIVSCIVIVVTEVERTVTGSGSARPLVGGEVITRVIAGRIAIVVAKFRVVVPAVAIVIVLVTTVTIITRPPVIAVVVVIVATSLVTWLLAATTIATADPALLNRIPLTSTAADACGSAGHSVSNALDCLEKAASQNL